MSTVQPTISKAVSTGDGSVITCTWVLTSTDVDGAPFQFTEWADRTWHAYGTWGGATLALQGSSAASFANPFTLSNGAGGSASVLTGDGGIASIELPLTVRPKLTTAGSGATVTVVLTARRSQPLRV